MCLKAIKIDEGHRDFTLKKAGPALDFEKSRHSGNLSKCKQSQLSHCSQKLTCQKFLSNYKRSKKPTIYNIKESPK